MQNRLNRYISTTFITIFLLVITVLSVLNFSNILLKGEEINLLYQQANYSKEFFSGLDDLYRDNFIKKEKWIDIYGLVQKLFQRRIIGSMEFAKNDDGLMEIIHLNKMGDGKAFADSLVELNQICNKFDTEFMYIQMPIRNDGSVPNSLIDLDNYYEDINENIKNENIWQVSGEDILGQGNLALTDLYLKTDIHLTTEGEMYMAQMISEKLSEKNIKIQNVIRGVNDNAYSKHSHKLLGNLVRSAGKYYNGEDTFNEYIPKNDCDTRFELSDLTTNTLIKTGTYSNTLMNDFDSSDQPNIYWVTNYLQYGKYAYNIKNCNCQGGPNIMFICDSYCYRTISFLSLGCKNITVIDPRFKSELESIEYFIKNNCYDAVICLHGTQLSLSLD